MKSLIVIAECGPSIGLGHVMRTLAVAEAARHAGWDVSFVCPELPPSIDKRLKAAGIALKAPGLPLSHAEAILVDGYGFGAEVLATWRVQTSCLALMDDNGEHKGKAADLVINPNPHADATLYTGWDSPQYLLGSAYAPLRKEFRMVEARFHRDARHLLLTMGGSDPAQLTGHVIHSLEEIDNTLEITAVVGGMAAAPDIGASRHTVTILRDVADMSALMRQADMAISAAGSSLWELAHLGVPTIAVTVAQGQVAAADAAARQGMLVLATRDTVAGEVRRLLAHEAARDALSTTGRKIVDGRGTERILAAMGQFQRARA